MSDKKSHNPKIPAELLKRMAGDVNVFHSNVYAREAHGERIGSTSRETFNQRLSVHKNRQHVQSFRDSRIGTNPGRNEHRQLNTDTTPGERRLVAPVQSPPKRQFQEPPHRPFNPFN